MPSTSAWRTPATRPCRGAGGVRTSRSGNGAPSARTTAPTARPGPTSATTRRGRGPTAGARTGSPASPTTASCSASPLALWNGRDPILKERLFGLTNREGNHGEDVKEYYFYLDATPTSSYLRYLYKYPQAAYPLRRPRRDERRRGRGPISSTSCSTPASSTTTATSTSRSSTRRRRRTTSPSGSPSRTAGPEAASLHLLPTLWFRNTWSWGADDEPRPSLARRQSVDGVETVVATHPELGTWQLRCEGADELLFTENETNLERLDGIDNRDAVRQGRVSTATSCTARATRSTRRRSAQRRRRTTTLTIEAGCDGRRPAATGRCRRATAAAVHDAVDTVIEKRRREADDFYATVIPPTLDADEALVMRSALAGMLWSKQLYHYDVRRWLTEHGIDPFVPGGPDIRNRQWQHMDNAHVISMPDKWEYPWFAAWDLAFHVLALTLVDEDFAKGQLELMLRVRLHPPERPDPRVRVELRRRQSAGPRLGDDLHVQTRGGGPRPRRRRLARADVPQAAHQLHLVGEPQGRRRQQPVRGRVPRPRQHRRVRP